MAREIVTKSQRFYCVSQKPDICKTPMGNSIPPIPYTIKGEFIQAVKISPNITSHGDKIVLHNRSIIPTVTGDSPGTAKGIKSGTVGDKVETKERSSTVHTNGTRPVREGDVVKMNANNTTGKIYERGGEAAQPQIKATGAEQPETVVTAEPTSLWEKASPWVHGALGLASFVPGLSVVTGAVDAAIYTAEGNLVEAGLSAASMIPGGKIVTTAGKAGSMALKGAQTAKKAEEIAQAARKAEEAAQAAKAAREAKVLKEAANKAKGKGKNGGKSKSKKTGEKGKCGEWLAKQDMMQEGFDDVVAVQNNSGHGIDLIGRNSQTGEVKVWEVKTTDGPSAPGLSKAQGMGGEKFTLSRLERAAAGQGNYGKVPEAMANAKKALGWLKKTGGKATYEKREVFIDNIDKGCMKHPNRLSRSKPWNAKP